MAASKMQQQLSLYLLLLSCELCGAGQCDRKGLWNQRDLDSKPSATHRLWVNDVSELQLLRVGQQRRPCGAAVGTGGMWAWHWTGTTPEASVFLGGRT